MPLDQLQARNDTWLAHRLEAIWHAYFQDIKRINMVVIRFGRKSRTRLGSIGMDGWQSQSSSIAYRPRVTVGKDTSVITITGYFNDPTVPEYVVDATIGHELVHYAHGFHSPHPQLYRHPHKGGVVDKELQERGMGEILHKQKQWLKQEWRTVTKPPTRRRRRVRLSFLPTFG